MSDLAVMTEHIRHLDIEAIAALTAPELACIMDDLAEQKASLALIEDKIRIALDRKYGARARQRRAEEGKDAGVVRFEDNGFVVIADLPKRVKWDQEKLRHAVEIIRTGWGDDPADYVKVKLEVSEAAFANWPRPVRELFIRRAPSKPGGRSIASRRRTAQDGRPHDSNSGGAARSARTGRQSFGARSTPRRLQVRPPRSRRSVGRTWKETANAGSHRDRRRTIVGST